MTLTGVAVTDPYRGRGLDRARRRRGRRQRRLLEVGETWGFTAAHTVTQAEIDSNGGGDGQLENTATADSNETGPDTDDASVPVALQPGAEHRQGRASVTGGTVALTTAGDVINYTITVAQHRQRDADRRRR